ncbi:hypothetical protein MMYC01_208002 [Madurella mycetomatis]|uniref:Uncharacterized protein n=1 Tax=Madurella mycetomatis TaxID=100816 RepID=A0A175VXB1_9PEZI|nr:hypothetical protein MMYC01_208002 [Madurella mycetomatis]
MVEANGNPPVPEQLYHTTLTVEEFHEDASYSTKESYVLGTHTTISGAKAFALEVLTHMDYKPGDFAEYATCLDTPSESWKHGDSVVVYARTHTGYEFLVGLAAKPNTGSLPAGTDGTLLLPKGIDHLHYVLQNKTDYNQDRSDTYQTTEIVGCYLQRAEALAAAKAVLRADCREYAQYDERDDMDQAGEWPFGEEVVIHAVAQTGENFTVAIKTAKDAYKKYRKNVGLGRQGCGMK